MTLIIGCAWLRISDLSRGSYFLMYRNIEQGLIILDTLHTWKLEEPYLRTSRSRKTLSHQDNLCLSAWAFFLLVLIDPSPTIYGFDFRLPKPNRISCWRSVLAEPYIKSPPKLQYKRHLVEISFSIPIDILTRSRWLEPHALWIPG